MNITKGKWEAVENMYYVDVMCNDVAIATAHSNEFNGISKEQMRANARMMAASPEVLEKLTEANETISFLIGIYNKRTKDPANFLDAEICNEIQVFIAKVKGEL